MFERFLTYGKRVFKEAGEDDVSGAAGELAYRLFLALFPFFIFLAAMGGFVADISNVQNPTQEVMDLLGESLPDDASSVLRGELEKVVESRNASLVSLGIIGAIWSASSGISTIVKGMNRIYEVKETRPIWKRYSINVGLTILGGVFAIGSFVLLFVGQLAGTEVAGEIGLENEAATALSLARWPLIVLMLIVATAFLYWAAPNVKLPFHWITPGAVVFIIGWLVASFLFGLYVSNFGSYNATSGTLGGIVVLLVWIYLTSFLLMLGVEINAVIAQEEVPEKLPQTADEGATEETVPPHRKADAANARGAPPQGVKPSMAPVRPAQQDQQEASQQNGAAPARTVTALALVVAAVTLVRLASRPAQNT
jgi:membrane protein